MNPTIIRHVIRPLLTTKDEGRNHISVHSPYRAVVILFIYFMRYELPVHIHDVERVALRYSN